MKTALVAGCRTPFLRSGTGFRKLSALDMGKVAVREVLARTDLSGADVDRLLFGTVVHNPHAPNLAREVGLGVLPHSVPASTVSMACASANQAIADGVNLVELGLADVVVAGGAESLSHVPILVGGTLSDALIQASRARSTSARIRAFSAVRPGDLVPVQPQIAEPTTGETMGEAAERMAKENGISREEQDRWALRSHRRAAEGTSDGRLPAEICPVYTPPDFEAVETEDNGIREDTSAEALAGLRPVFDRRHGSVTAGNASPLTDGAAAVVLMSQQAVEAHGVEPMAWIRSYAITALDPGAQLLQGPAYAAPLALDRAGISMADVDLMEMHEAFAAQVLSNLQALDSDRFAREELGRAGRVGHPPEDQINVMGGSIALGHPFGATGARLTTTLAHELRRRDGQFGLLTVCAAGGLGFAMVLERA
jgi:acetyl-CoA acyltransferase